MDEGVFKVLRVLSCRTPLMSDEVSRLSGEAPTVVEYFLKSYPAWIESFDRKMRASEKGLAALALEMVARQSGNLTNDGDWQKAFLQISSQRKLPKNDLDQVFATPESVLRRARRLIESGEAQRGLCFLGDDDLTSIGTLLLGIDRKVTVLDIDQDMLQVINDGTKNLAQNVDAIAYDARDPVPLKLKHRFGCVVTDPPYAKEGFELFISRAIDLLRPDGRLWVFHGCSRRAPERALEKQKILVDAGIMIEEVIPEFTVYDGADSIGGQSSLYIGRLTASSKPLIKGQDSRQDLYTKRAPIKKSPKKIQ